MATNESWDAREMIVQNFFQLKKFLGFFKLKFLELEQIKLTIFDDPIKIGDIKLLFDQDPNISMDEVLANYEKARALYDLILANGA